MCIVDSGGWSHMVCEFPITPYDMVKNVKANLTKLSTSIVGQDFLGSSIFYEAFIPSYEASKVFLF